MRERDEVARKRSRRFAFEVGLEASFWLEDRLVAFELFEFGWFEGVDLASMLAQANEGLGHLDRGADRVDHRNSKPRFKLHVEPRHTGATEGDRFCAHGDGLPPRIFQGVAGSVPQMLGIGHSQVGGENADASLGRADAKTGLDDSLLDEVLDTMQHGRHRPLGRRERTPRSRPARARRVPFGPASGRS
jgi:hypothetical protein